MLLEPSYLCYYKNANSYESKFLLKNIKSMIHFFLKKFLPELSHCPLDFLFIEDIATDYFLLKIIHTFQLINTFKYVVAQRYLNS